MSFEHCVCGICEFKGVFLIYFFLLYIFGCESVGLAYNDTPEDKNVILGAKEDQSFNTTEDAAMG